MNKALLRRAATLLAADAELTRQSCQGRGHNWACGDCKTDGDGKCQARRDYDARVLASKQLREEARKCQ